MCYCEGIQSDVLARLAAIEETLRRIDMTLMDVVSFLAENASPHDGYIRGLSEGYRRLYELAEKWKIVGDSIIEGIRLRQKLDE